jgi:hypothetical protein
MVHASLHPPRSVASPKSWVGTLLGSGAVLLVACGVLYARHLRSSQAVARATAAMSAAAARGDPVLRVPHAPGAITLDGDTDDPGWVRPPGPARTGDFVLENGQNARPYSNTRIVWSDGYLYLSLYAADEDIENHADQPDSPLLKEDAFHVVFSQPGVEYAIDVSPTGVLTDAIRRDGGAWDFSWSSGAHASKEIDGTINNPNNTDEEWAIEMAVPFESLGMKGERGETIGLSLSRCDTPKGASRVCAGWGEGFGGHGRGRILLE